MSGLPTNPNGRRETYLANIAGENVQLPSNPQGREEEYLDYIARNGGGGGGGGATIDDSEPAYNKVYSSEKTEEIADTKVNMSEMTFVIPTNLFDSSTSKKDWKPSSSGGATYSDGSALNGYNTTNLFACTPNQKFKCNMTEWPSYTRCFCYNANKEYVVATSPADIDTDGYCTFEVAGNNSIAYACLVANFTTTQWNNLYIDQYANFGPRKAIVNDLWLSDDNVAMAKERLGIDETEDVLNGKKWCVAGDSFTYGDFTGVTTPTIPDGKYAGERAVYPYLIGNRCNMTIQNLSRGGRTLAYAADASDENSFVNYYQTVAADADYLTMYFGINDSHRATAETGQIPLGTISDATTATFYGAWNVILTWLITNRPNLHIGIIVSNGCDSDDYRTATIAIAKKYGLPYIDLNGDERTPCMMRSTNADVASAVRTQRTNAWKVSSTNAHPNADCHKFESTIIENFLRSL